MNLLAKYLQKRKKTTSELAKEVNTSTENLRMIKNNERLPRVDLAIRIAEALNCTVQDLWIFPVAFLFIFYIGIGSFDKRIYKEPEAKTFTWTIQMYYKTTFIWTVSKYKKAVDYNFNQ